MPYPHCTKQELALVPGTGLPQWNFSYMFSLNFANSVTKIFALKGLELATPCVRDQDATAASATHIYHRQDI